MSDDEKVRKVLNRLCPPGPVIQTLNDHIAALRDSGVLVYSMELDHETYDRLLEEIGRQRWMGASASSERVRLHTPAGHVDLRRGQ